MGPIGMQEMVAIFLVALVLFGPKKLPELGRTIAKAITEFRRASNDLKATFEREMQSLERESESIKDVMHPIASEIQSHTNFDSIRITTRALMGPMRTIPPQPILPQ
jgi:sec-independent protein translocase protein TatA